MVPSTAQKAFSRGFHQGRLTIRILTRRSASSHKFPLTAFTLGLFLFTACTNPTRGTPWRSLPLATGSLEIYYEEPNFAPFAPHTLHFYLEQDGETRLLASTQLHNDGANLGDHNIEFIEVNSDRWQIWLKGAEQADEVWLLEQSDGAVTLAKEE